MKVSRLALACALLVVLWSVGRLAAEPGPAVAQPPSAAGTPETSPAKEGGADGPLHALRNILGWRLAIAGIVISAVGCVGLMLLAAAMVPRQVARAEQALRRGPWKLVLLGIVSVLVLLLAAALLGKAKQAGAHGLGLLAAAALCFLVWLAGIGLSATAKIVGQRLLSDEGGSQSLWRVVGAGAIAIAAAALLPVFGWAFFIFLLCRGVGAATLALFARPEPPPTPEAPG